MLFDDAVRAYLDDTVPSMAELRDSVSQMHKVVSVSMPATSIPANTAATQSAAVPKVDGYSPLGIVGCNSWHGQLVYQGFELSGDKVIVTLRNLSSAAISATGVARVLYVRNA